MDGGRTQLQPAVSILRSKQEVSLQEIDDWGDVDEPFGSKCNLTSPNTKNKENLQKLFSIEEVIPQENAARSPDTPHSALQPVDLSNSRLADFPADLAQQPGGSSLDLSGNWLTRLDTWAARAALKTWGGSLVRLALARNFLAALPNSLAALCPHLVQLDLAHNLLRDVTPLARLTNLVHLDLEHNPFLFVDKSLAGLTKLESLSFDWPKLIEGPPPSVSNFFDKVSLRDRYSVKDFLADFGHGKQQPTDAGSLRGLVYDEAVGPLAAALALRQVPQVGTGPGIGNGLGREALVPDPGWLVDPATSELLDNAVSRDRARSLFVLLCFLPDKISRLD
jgi:hypothetical protein